MGGASLHIMGVVLKDTTSAFPVVTEVQVEALVKEILCCIVFPAECFPEVVTMVS